MTIQSILLQVLQVVIVYIKLRPIYSKHSRKCVKVICISRADVFNEGLKYSTTISSEKSHINGDVGCECCDDFAKGKKILWQKEASRHSIPQIQIKQIFSTQLFDYDFFYYISD